ncbi:UNVERIFIED_CONTAM: hypothetical protein FKN15_059646 [Acipenser sinensis]
MLPSSMDLSRLQLLVVSTAVGAGGLLVYFLVIRRRTKTKTLPMGDGWWGAGEKPLAEDEEIHPFQIVTSDEEIKDLYMRIDQTRFTPSLEDSQFNYGFNSTHLRKVVSYWRNQFDWKKQVKLLNKYPHFKTKIEGLDVHFVHVRPSGLQEGHSAKPLLMVHGWPGSFFEFYKILPLLTEGRDGLVFEVICPSIPGYGFSEAPHKTGGQNVKGLHLNFFPVTKHNLRMLVSLLLGAYVPFLVGFTREDVKRIFPYFKKNVYEMLRESGYMHIQATKPDTAGCGLNDSPVGLAAYILEKFSTWTDKQFRDLEDGGLERKFSLDDLLTNVMIYWVTGSMVSSMRFYKENLNTNPEKRPDAK